MREKELAIPGKKSWRKYPSVVISLSEGVKIHKKALGNPH